MASMHQLIKLDGKVGKVGLLTQTGDSVKLEITVRASGLVKEGEEPNDRYVDKKGVWAQVDLWNSRAKQAALRDASHLSGITDLCIRLGANTSGAKLFGHD